MPSVSFGRRSSPLWGVVLLIAGSLVGVVATLPGGDHADRKRRGVAGVRKGRRERSRRPFPVCGSALCRPTAADDHHHRSGEHQQNRRDCCAERLSAGVGEVAIARCIGTRLIGDRLTGV